MSHRTSDHGDALHNDELDRRVERAVAARSPVGIEPRTTPAESR